MKKLLCLVCVLVVAPIASAADGVGVFQAGLRDFQINGADALLGTWYGTDADQERLARLRERLNKLSRELGPVVDTQVFAPHSLGRHVQRLYGVLYFQKRPLWLRADFYEINGRSGFVALEFSLVPDDVLPLTWVTLRE
ncbi:hypothetical protein [Opitutus terrae]|uniref:DUF3887 domain-containing protein n=1 Tax=Opitutus terrae (strain DSM 11246 / JCM 15787 / PB90-1) TaxID=452637 RepID=B1ZZI1_OPITP|nr:hypothetical protein [Opitutus terrae]ACB76384.1 hypothetical protein Oter_3104 [Opitutus terrae PB90-1]